MKININIEQFAEEFRKQYDFLYNSNGYVPGYDEAVEAFDNFLERHANFVGEFVNYRHDFISSDREAAAFMFALSVLLDDNFDLDKYLDEKPQSLLTPIYRGIYE